MTFTPIIIDLSLNRKRQIAHKIIMPITLQAGKSIFSPKDQPLEAILQRVQQFNLRKASKREFIDFGEYLYHLLFPDMLDDWFQKNIEVASDDVWLQLQVSSRALDAIPWELTYLPFKKQFISISSGICMSRRFYTACQKSTAPSRLTILVIVSQPLRDVCAANKIPFIDHTQELETIRRIIEEFNERKLDIKILMLEKAGLKRVHKEARKQYNLIHYIGPVLKDDEDYLQLYSESGKPEKLSASELARFIRPNRLQAVLLEGVIDAGMKEPYPLQQICHQLLDQSCPTIIPLHRNASHAKHLEFIADLYRYIIGGYMVPSALNKAKRNLNTNHPYLLATPCYVQNKTPRIINKAFKNIYDDLKITFKKTLLEKYLPSLLTFLGDGLLHYLIYEAIHGRWLLGWLGSTDAGFHLPRSLHSPYLNTLHGARKLCWQLPDNAVPTYLDIRLAKDQSTTLYETSTPGESLDLASTGIKFKTGQYYSWSLFYRNEDAEKKLLSGLFRIPGRREIERFAQQQHNLAGEKIKPAQRALYHAGILQHSGQFDDAVNLLVSILNKKVPLHHRVMCLYLLQQCYTEMRDLFRSFEFRVETDILNLKLESAAKELAQTIAPPEKRHVEVK